MSGSTENLLQHGPLRESVESIYNSREKTIHDERRSAQTTGNKGIINPAFIADDKHNERPSSPYKRATSFQQRPSSSSSPTSRRHSSPDGSDRYGVKHKAKHGLNRQHRLTSASEEDLRRKAVLNSMKAERKFQSVSHLPNSIENEAQISGTRDAGIEVGTKNVVKEKIDNNEDLRKAPVKSQDEESLLSKSSSHQTDFYQDNVVVALERAQLHQYKRRLTLALNERAKLTEQLQFLTSNLTNSQLSQSFDSYDSLDSPRPLETSSRVGESPRRPENTSSPRYPSLTGADDANDRCLPTLPSKDKTKGIERLNLKDVENDCRDSDPTYAVRIVDNNLEDSPAGKEFPETKLTSKEHTNRRNSFKREQRESKREDLNLAANDMWYDHLRGESFATGDMPANTKKSDNSKLDKDKSKDRNNNTKKPLTVEEFLSSDKETEKVRAETKDFDENDKAIRRVLERSSLYSPELYEPVVDHFGNKKQNEHLSHSARNNSKPRKGTEAKSKHYETDQDYEQLTTVGGVRTQRGHMGYHYEEMASPKVRKPELQSKNHTKHDRDRRFNYMGPPGTIRTANSRGKQGDSSDTSELERAPSNISDKLRYYRGVLGNQNEERPSHDLADAFANETDPLKRREIQQQAAAEAAVLRREASELLFQAMNLERLCDPNARVRHVYIPH